MNYTIFCDNREYHASEEADMIKKLEASGLPFEKKHLLVGDYILKELDTGAEICVERKILTDFVGSVRDGRLFKELEQMENSYSHSFLILVGTWDKIRKENVKLKQMRIVKSVNWFSVPQRLGVFASISCRYKNVKLIQIENDNQFLEILPKLLEKTTDGKGYEHQHIIKNKRPEDAFLNVLKAFPNISSDKAKKIIEKYSSWKEFSAAVIDKTFEVDGIGKIGTSTFYKFITGIDE